jgi:hypothetical protein
MVLIMSKQKDGGQAFPGIDIVCGDNALGSKGMSLRDWFAGQALVALVSGQDRVLIGNYCSESGKEIATVCADWSYAQADAMLKAREQ